MKYVLIFILIQTLSVLSHGQSLQGDHHGFYNISRDDSAGSNPIYIPATSEQMCLYLGVAKDYCINLVRVYPTISPKQIAKISHEFKGGTLLEQLPVIQNRLNELVLK